MHEGTDVDTKQTDRQTKPSVGMIYDAVMELSQHSQKKKMTMKLLEETLKNFFLRQ